MNLANHLLTVFVTASARVLLTFRKIISFAVSILMGEVIPTTSKKGFSRAACSLKFVQMSQFHGHIYANALTQTYSNIFISPSSSESFIDADENGAARKKQRTASNSQKKATKRNVATILGMEGRVTPRSIAYAAVLVGLVLFFKFSILSLLL